MDAHRRRRLLDLAVVLVTAPLVLVLVAAGALAVLVRDGRPVLYRQVRCGWRGRPFLVNKLRTMRDAPGADLTAVGDARVTGCGALLRLSKLDELPQFWNVLVGDMALVGPRPEVPAWVARHAGGFGEALQVRPGITSVSSLHYRHEARALADLVDAGVAGSVEEAYDRVVLPHKLEMDVAYTSRCTARSDLAVLALTLWAVLSGRAPRKVLSRLTGVGT